jgi:hypothetical protein
MTFRLTKRACFLTASQNTWSKPGGVGGMVGMDGRIVENGQLRMDKEQP